MCIYVYIYVCIYVDIYVYIHVWVHVLYMDPYMDVHMDAYIGPYIRPLVQQHPAHPDFDISDEQKTPCFDATFILLVATSYCLATTD